MRIANNSIFDGTTLALLLTLSLLHVLNYLNYSTLAAILDFPMIRAGILAVAFTWVLFTRFGNLARYHLKENYDLYAFVALALVSAVYAEKFDQTLLYAVWLFLACYVALEISSRLKQFPALVWALLIIIVPAVVVSGLITLLIGVEVVHTGRVFGALGTKHVDAAIALNAILLFLAITSVGGRNINFGLFLRWVLLAVLLYSTYITIFSLTRAVWVCLLFGLMLFALSSGKNFRLGSRVSAVLLVAVLLFTIFFNIDVSLPDSVENRVEQTLQRYEAGTVDVRVVKFEQGLELFKERPLLGFGYNSGSIAHNSYLNMLIDTGLIGLAICIVAFFRSATILISAGRKCLMFFLIGAGGLFVHAAFESQNTPGQANFIPLVTWMALSRSRYVLDRSKSRKGVVEKRLLLNSVPRS